MKRIAESQETNGRLSAPRRLIDRYNRGYSTASELMLGFLTLTDKDEIREAVSVIPKQVLKKLEHFVGYYTPETRVFNGPPPEMETVQFVKALLARGKPRQRQ